MARRSPARTLRGRLDSRTLAAASRGELADAHALLLEAAEREIFSRAIQRARGNQAQVARWLGLTRLTVRDKLLHFGLHPSQEREER